MNLKLGALLGRATGPSSRGSGSRPRRGPSDLDGFGPGWARAASRPPPSPPPTRRSVSIRLCFAVRLLGCNVLLFLRLPLILFFCLIGTFVRVHYLLE